MNEAQAEKVVYFVKKVLAEGKSQADIGVVTPYRRQVRKLPTTYASFFLSLIVYLVLSKIFDD